MDELDALEERRTSRAADTLEAQDDDLEEDSDAVATTTRIEPAHPVPPPQRSNSFLSPNVLGMISAVVAVPAVIFFAFQQWKKASLSAGKVCLSLPLNSPCMHAASASVRHVCVVLAFPYMMHERRIVVMAHFLRSQSVLSSNVTQTQTSKFTIPPGAKAAEPLVALPATPVPGQPPPTNEARKTQLM
jgi:hypothetical protein